MRRTHTSRSFSIAAQLVAAACLLASAGCGFCLVQPNCGIGCCVDFQCRQPEDCPIQIVPLKTRTGAAQSGQDPLGRTSPDPDCPNEAPAASS